MTLLSNKPYELIILAAGYQVFPSPPCSPLLWGLLFYSVLMSSALSVAI